jgi:hypothetical protein
MFASKRMNVLTLEKKLKKLKFKESAGSLMLLGLPRDS